MTAEDAAGESDVQSINSDAPPAWNSDDEPPEDHEGDENTCSRDGAVKKVIKKVGKGLERPGQNDIVTVRFSTLQLDAPPIKDVPGEITVEMGDNKLPLAIEFAVKNMRVGEVAEVRAPAAYSLILSPLCGRQLRTQPGVLPKTGKVKRKLRFLPAAPNQLAEQAKSDLLKFRKAQESAANGSGSTGPASPPMFRARVELLGFECVQSLTEDRSVTKRIIQTGSSRRRPRRGDVVTFSYTVIEDAGKKRSSLRKCELTLGEDELPFPRLEHILFSMKEEERCLARLLLCGADDQDEGPGPETIQLEVTLLRWRRRDLLPVLPPGEAAQAEGAGSQNAGQVSAASALQKTEIRQGPERRCHDIEAGSMVLAAFLHPGQSKPILLSWRVGEEAVPGYIEVAVASMRLCECADFKAPETVQLCRPTGPSYEGKTPLRTLEVGELRPLLDELLADDEAAAPTALDDTGSPSNLSRQPYHLPQNWAAQGQPVAWADLTLVEDGSFRLALLDATEAIDLCLLEEAGQLHFLELERAHGNALAREGRYEEASEAYKRALDAVRRSPMYKALFPTERGHIQGAYSREALEENPLQGLSEEEVSTRRSHLVALHLNLSLCGNKAGLHSLARRHADIALGAEPENAKALFRRGQAAAGQSDFEAALQDLQKAAELQPQDRTIRAEIQSVQRGLRAHKEVQKTMFQNVFQPARRSPGTFEGGQG